MYFRLAVRGTKGVTEKKEGKENRNSNTGVPLL